MKWQCWLLSVLMSAPLMAAADFPHIFIEPGKTDANIKEIKGPHVAYWNPNHSNHKLLITFGGTTSRPEDLYEFAQTAAGLGYHVISVDYYNLVITTACRDSQDVMCFDHFRKEIIAGEPVSDLLEVDRANSALSRLRKLMEFLMAQDPRWNEFYENGDFKWQDVVVMGNSQGAGHAAYISKMFEVARVVMVIGPQDHFKEQAAPWISQEGATRGTRYYAFLHRDDYFDSKMQVACYKKLCQCQDMSRVIITTRAVQDTHNSLLTPMFRDEWKQLLTL